LKVILRRLVRHIAFTQGRFEGLYKRLCRPDGTDWAAYLKRRDVLFAMGEHCSVQTNVTLTDPKYVRLGNNVRLSGCTLFGHDGVVNMLNHAYGLKLDRVGKIDIRDNVFIGHGAIVLPGATIGPNSVVAAGAVVSGDVKPDCVYGGIPARPICSIDELVTRMSADLDAYPWRDLIAQRAGAFDPQMQPELDRRRMSYFFGPPQAEGH